MQLEENYHELHVSMPFLSERAYYANISLQYELLFDKKCVGELQKYAIMQQSSETYFKVLFKATILLNCLLWMPKNDTDPISSTHYALNEGERGSGVKKDLICP